MSLSTGRIPKYRKHSSGQARVTINGRDYLLGPHGTKTSKNEYDRVIAEFLASGRSPTFGIQQDAYTVAMLIRDYLSHARSYYGTDEASDYHRIIPALKPVKALYAKSNAADFGPTQIKAVRETMVRSGLTRQGVNRRIKLIVRAFKWAASEAKIPASVYETLRLGPSLKKGRTLAPESEPVTPVDMDTVEATLEQLSPVVADMVRVQLLIGCRPGEVCQLSRGCIDQSGDVWVARLSEHKTAHHGHDRLLFIGPETQAILSRYLSRDDISDDDSLFRPCDAVAIRRERDRQNRVTPLSCGNRPGRKYGAKGLRGSKAIKTAGDSYTVHSYRRAIHAACDRAFLPPPPLAQQKGETKTARDRRLTDSQKDALKQWQSDHRWSPNRLRHSRGTEVRRKYGLEGSQVTLGHKSADVTQVYAERDIELGKRIAREIG